MKKYKTAVYQPQLAYAEAVMVWARSLPHVELMSMVEDYRRGDRDPASIDAFNEYLRRSGRVARFGASVEGRGHTLKPYQSRALLPRCDRHRVGRYPSTCADCDAVAREGDRSVQQVPESLVTDQPDDEVNRGDGAIKEPGDQLLENPNDPIDRSMIDASPAITH